MSREHLETYLNDHLAGSVTQLEILDQLAEEATDLKAALERLRIDIGADRQELITLMRHLDIKESRLRRATGWIAEQIAEAKLVIDDDEGGHLRRLERLELMVLGIEGKLRLWQALEAASQLEPRLGILDYPWLIQRAHDQRVRVETLRLEAAKAALKLAA
jgi:hypothetical protein